MKFCPVCNLQVKQITPKHIKGCFGDDPLYKIKYINHNFPLTKDRVLLERLYSTEKKSLPIVCKEVGGLDLKSMVYVLRYYDIPIRTIKETRNLEEYKQRIESTNLIKYGSKNPLSKGTEPWKRRNKTVIDKYGVENVWQCIDLFVDSYGISKGNKISSLNLRIESVLKTYQVRYEREFRISYDLDGSRKWKFFDFLIEDLILEVNGDYWHANPKKYNKDHSFQFPKTKLRARDIWEMDKYKKSIAESAGYRVIYLWESDIKEMSDEEIYQYIKDCINKEDR